MMKLERLIRPWLALFLGFAHAVHAAPECTAPAALQGADAERFCMIHTFRVACLTRKGYGVEGENWTVPLSAYDECTILGCDQLMEQAGDLSEALFRAACDVIKVDRSG